MNGNSKFRERSKKIFVPCRGIGGTQLKIESIRSENRAKGRERERDLIVVSGAVA